MISLVVPVRDEEASLPTLLDSVRRQTRPPDEVILVDGGSTDRTVALARELSRGDARLRVVEAGEATPGRGRNVGVAAASHEWIAFTDAGIRLEPDWLARLAAEVERDPALDVVYGNYEPLPRTFFERCAAVAYVSPKSRPPEAPCRGRFIASSLVRREVWRRAGGFPDLRAAEDLIFMERVAASGARTAWAPRATVWWQLQPTLWRTFRRFMLYSKHNVWAGRQRYWHYGVARLYAAGLVFVSLALLHSPWWLVAPALGLLARAAKSVAAHREGRPLWWALSPARLLTVAAIILAVDAGTFAGWAQALVTKQKARGGEAGASTAGGVDG
ncbi:MAG: glycosyltransferase [Acidobacteria bacterium]|nr:glycosyltransferase [Acidobacteriota bacterium]